MSPQLKQKWIDALLSGKYRQGKYALKVQQPGDPDTVCYCCIGVLCDIINHKAWTTKHFDNQKGQLVYQWTNKNYQAITASFNPEHCIDIGLPATIHQTLIDMNDTKNRNFEYIANWIKENL